MKEIIFQIWTAARNHPAVLPIFCAILLSAIIIAAIIEAANDKKGEN